MWDSVYGPSTFFESDETDLHTAWLAWILQLLPSGPSHSLSPVCVPCARGYTCSNTDIEVVDGLWGLGLRCLPPFGFCLCTFLYLLGEVICMEVREQLVVIGSLLPHGSWGLSSRH